MKKEIKIDFLVSYAADDIITELQRISQVVGGRPLTKADIAQHGRVSYQTIHKRFGGLSKAVIAAGLVPHIYHNVTDEELLDALVTLWSKTLSEEGRRPERRDLKRYGVLFSGDTYYSRFGSWKKALLEGYKSLGREESITDANDGLRTQIAAVPRGDLSLRKRFIVFKRDEFTCVMCGRSGRGVKLEVDHSVPRSRGGTDELKNLQTLCFECNRGKRADFQEAEG